MKPRDMHLGVVDFFAIVLPGAIAVAYLDKIGGRTYAQEMLPAASFSGIAGWVLFALAAYAVGHLVFLLASLLDKYTYDFFRRRVWRDVPGNAYNRTKALRDKALGTEDPRLPMNTFSWAKAVLQLRAKQAAVDIARLEADQKFFRSLCVVLSAVGVHSLFREQMPAGIVLVIVGLFAYARYVERRYKSTQWGLLLRHCGIDGNDGLGGNGRRESQRRGRGRRMMPRLEAPDVVRPEAARTGSRRDGANARERPGSRRPTSRIRTYSSFVAQYERRELVPPRATKNGSQPAPHAEPPYFEEEPAASGLCCFVFGAPAPGLRPLGGYGRIAASRALGDTIGRRLRVLKPARGASHARCCSCSSSRT